MKKKIYLTVVFVIAITANIFLSLGSSSSTSTSISDLFSINAASAEDGIILGSPYKMEYYAWGCRCEEVPYSNLCYINNQCMCSWGGCECCW